MSLNHKQASSIMEKEQTEKALEDKDPNTEGGEADSLSLLATNSTTTLPNLQLSS